MTRRRGITLVEVLVAIFIMAVGMICLLTLFPVGAISIAQALRDDRAQQAAANATAYANALDLRQDSLVVAQFNLQAASLSTSGPSSPVCVDPALTGTTLGGVINRISPSYASTPVLKYYWFTLLDELNFNTNGKPTLDGTNIERNSRFTWAYMLRRPRLSDARIVEMSVMVYDNRPNASLGEPVVTGAGTVGTTSLNITYTATAKPKIKNGGWILDVGTDGPGTPVRGYFYRVVDSNDIGATQTSLELQVPLRAAVSGNIVVLENVVEVFDRGSGYQTK